MPHHHREGWLCSRSDAARLSPLTWSSSLLQTRELCTRESNSASLLAPQACCFAPPAQDRQRIESQNAQSRPLLHPGNRPVSYQGLTDPLAVVQARAGTPGPMALPDCTEEELQALYEWVDSVPLSRPKKSITRDFADGGEGLAAAAARPPH